MKYYSDIRILPLENYLLCNDTGDVRYLIESPTLTDLPYITAKQEDELKQAYESIKDQVLDVTGISDNCQIVMQMQKDITLLKSEIILEGDASLMTQLHQRVKDLNDYIEANSKQAEKNNAYMQIAVLEKFLGFQINTRLTSVKRWLAYNDLFTEHLKRDGRKSDTK